MKRNRYFWQDVQGMAFIEFGLALPFLMLCFMGSIEVSRYILLNQKIDKVTHLVGDIVSQSQTISQSEMDQLLQAMDQIASPYPISTTGRVILSSVSFDGFVNRVRWQYCGGGNLSANSQIGTLGGVATMPANLTPADKEDVIIAEIAYRYTPEFFDGFVNPQTMIKTAVFRPRLGALDSTVLVCS